MRIPTFLITGLEPTALDSTALGLLCDLPESVVVRHEVSHEHNTLTRTVSDVRGLLEREVISLGHACIPCAIREDVVPTLARLAATGSWPSQIAVLPSGADARQVCRFVSRSPSVAAPFKIAGVVAALSGETLERDLTGGDLLVRGLLRRPALRRRGQLGAHRIRRRGERSAARRAPCLGTWVHAGHVVGPTRRRHDGRLARLSRGTAADRLARPKLFRGMGVRRTSGRASRAGRGLLAADPQLPPAPAP